MKWRNFLFLIVMGFVFSYDLLASGSENGQFKILPGTNPEYRGNELFRAFDSYYNPRVKQLRERYGLDQVVMGESEEWRRILLLRHWINSNIRIENDHPTQTRGDAFAILDAAMQGGGFHCAHFSIVLEGVLNSFGYLTRRLGCGPGQIDHGGHHGVNEVWVNSLCKWVLIDAKYNVHFEKDGVPLSALEIRDEVWRDGGKSVVRCFGLDKKHETDLYPGDFGPTVETYRWCSWENTTNRFTAFPATGNSVLFMLEDDISRNNVWYRDGKPHWAYNTPYLITTTRRDWIEWTPNVIQADIEINDHIATVLLSSFTPNLRSYQMLGKSGMWVDCDENLSLHLLNETNRFAFRTMNLFGVSGPIHRIEIAWEPGNP